MVWVFGPGEGELVAVRAPTAKWLIVDGCTARSKSYGLLLLEHYQERPTLLLMSHPHRDHARGVAEVIESHTRRDPSTWPRMGMVPAPDTEGAGDEWDAEAALRGGVAEHVIGTILHRWNVQPACRWELEVGTSESLGEATVRILSPTDKERSAARAAWREGRRREYDFNRAATALLVSWRGRRVLLGSDLVDTPGQGWRSASSHDRDLREHDVYKIAHHGSENALGAHIRRPSNPSLRTWIATPFASKGLPDFRDLGGAEKLLAVESPMLLCGLPRTYPEQSGSVESTRREYLRDKPDHEFEKNAPGFPDCYVCVIIPEVGPVSVERGVGSISLSR